MNTTPRKCKHLASRPIDTAAKHLNAWELFECHLTPSFYGDAEWLDIARELVHDHPTMTGTDVFGHADIEMISRHCHQEDWGDWLTDTDPADGDFISTWSIVRTEANDWKCLISIHSADLAMRFKLTFC